MLLLVVGAASLRKHFLAGGFAAADGAAGPYSFSGSRGLDHLDGHCTHDNIF